MGQELVSEEQRSIATFVCGRLGIPSKLADHIVEADNFIASLYSLFRKDNLPQLISSGPETART